MVGKPAYLVDNAMRGCCGAAVCVCLALALSTYPALALDGPARVIDGDTMVIAHERIRLQNFNAPELDQPGGQQAKAKLQQITRGKTVHCDGKARDKYARLVARCSVNGVDIGKEMRQPY